VDKNKGLAGADDPMLSRQTVDEELPNLHDDQFGSRTHGSRNVFMGLVVTTGRIGATTGRLVLLPARVLARSPLVEPLRGRTEKLAETGRNAEIDARRRLESAAEGVLSAPEAEHVVDGVLAGALPEAWQCYGTVEAARIGAREMLDNPSVLQVAIIEDRPPLQFVEWVGR